MGRKKLLKLQRKLNKEQEAVSEKRRRSKIIKSVIFLAVFIFAAYQVNIALDSNKNIESDNVSVDSSDSDNTQEGSTALQDYGTSEESSREDFAESMESANNTDNDLQKGSTQSMEPTEQEYGANRVAVIETNKGNIKLELYTNDAPNTVENFVKLANENFYDGIKFHRVISDFMIQTGDPLSKDDDPANDGTGGPGYSFEDEINFHKMEVGSLAMANSGPNTNGSQFFIVTEKAQPHLDGLHTVFGKVVEGMDVVTIIEQWDMMNMVYIE